LTNDPVSGVRRLAKNSVFALVARVASLSSRLIVTMVLARYLGKALFGDYNYITALVGSFELLADLGLNQIAVREIAIQRDRADEYFGSVLLLKAFLMLATLGVLVVVAQVIPGSAHVRTGLYLYGLSVVLNFMASTYFVLYRAFERMHYEALLVLIARGTHVLLLVVLVSRQADFIHLFLANLAAVLIKLVVGSWLTVTRFTVPKIRINWRLYKHYLRETLPVGIGQIINSASVRLDIVLLGLLMTSESVGVFSGPYRVVDAVGLLSVVFVTALFPTMARRADVGREQLRQLVRTAVKVMLLVAVPAAIGLAILARPALTLLLGSEFADSEPVLQVLTPIIVPIYLNRLFNFAFISIKRQVEYAYISGATLLLNVILDLILIPRIGYWGACVGAVSAEAVRLVLCSWRIQRQIGSLGLGSILLRIVLPNLALTAVLLALVSWSWVAAALVGVVVYVAVVLVAGSLDAEEKEALYNTLGKARIRLG
jgi:O-antigen/teichoic acid export membrane protein